MPVVDTIQYEQLGVAVPVKFTKNTGLFSCQYAGVTYEDAQINTLRTKVFEVIKAGMQVQWIPILQLIIESPERQECRIRLEAERLYAAYLPAVGWKTSHWGCPESGRVKASQDADTIMQKAVSPDHTLQLPYQGSTYSSRRYLLPYSEEHWTQIKEIQKYLVLVNQLLSTHLAMPEGIASILETCHRMFDSVAAAGGDNDDEE